MKVALALIVVALSTPALGELRQVVGQAGYLGEWDLTATVAVNETVRSQSYSGPLTLTHVGMCTQDGPEKKTGELQFQISGWTSRMSATLMVDGVACTFNGKFSESYTGMMVCPDRRPVPLTLWIK